MGEKKNPQLECPSPESSLTQGDSDSESTSVSSSMQGSISSATSSLDRESSNVKEGTKTKKVLKKSNSKKLASFGSFMSSRRRTQSRLSQSSINVSDDGSTTPPDPSSIEVSDESSNYVQKSTSKFTRNGSLRLVKIFRNKNKNKSSFKSNKSSNSTDTHSEISEESHFPKATFSSILKDSKFPEHLKHQPSPSDPEEVLPVAKFCPYQHCSLHGHHHHHEPPPTRFAYLKRRTTNDQNTLKKPETRSSDKKSSKKREVKVNKRVSDKKSVKDDHDFSIEFYAKGRSDPVENYGHDGDSQMADILFGVNSWHEKKNEVPMSGSRDFSDLKEGNDGNVDGSKSVVEKKPALKKANQMSMWHMIHRHMVSGLENESGDKIVQQIDEEKKPNSTTKDYDDVASQETEIRKMFAIKLVRDAIEKILLPEVQDDQSTTSGVIPEQDLPEKNEIGGETVSDKTVELQEPQATGTAVEVKTEKQTPKHWSRLKKVFLLRKFVKELEKVKKFNPKKPTHLPLPPQHEPETVSLRRQKTGDKKNADEWMLDFALQKVVGELAPTQKRKVALLVKAFETVAPAQDDQIESRPNTELERVKSETKSKLQDVIGSTNVEMKKTVFEIKTPPNVISRSNSDIESTTDLGTEKRIKMWHMIYQHVVTDIATKMGSDLLLDGDDSTTSEDKNLQEVEDHTERNYRLAFTQSDAVKLVRESVDEILLPDIPDASSQVSDRELPAKKEDDDGELKKLKNDSVTDENKKPTIGGAKLSIASRLQNQRSENWSKLKKLILLKRSIKALEGFRKLKPQTLQKEVTITDAEKEKVDLRRQMMDERKKAEQWMLDYAVQHIVTKLTPARKKRVSMLVEAFEAVVPLPEF